MDYFITASLSILGLLVGSFLNVVILRWNTGFSISRGRSKCFSCGKTLKWYELLPVFSFLFLKGRCSECGSRISWQYPLVEIATAVALPAAFWLSPDYFIFIAIFLCLYIVVFVYDLKHKIIPDFFSYWSAVIALLLIAWQWQTTGAIDLYRIIGGPSLFLFFYFFWFVSDGKWMGLGDAKLALGMGWMLGLWHGIAAVLMAFWIGAIFSLILITIKRLAGKRGFGMKSTVPFGPFIIIGFLLSLFFGIDIQTILFYLAL